MKKIVITGANGFIGRKLIEKLIDQRIAICALDCVDNFSIQSEILKYYKCNLEENEIPFDKSFQNADAIFHFAWNGVHPDHRNDYERQLKNISSLIKVLLFAKNHSVSRIIIPGAASEYAVSEMPITGNNASGAVDGYGAVKSACHVIARTWSMQNNLPLIWVIPSSVYGPGRNDSNALTYTIKTLLKGEKPSFTALEQRWDYIYIDDFVNALLLIAAKGVAGKNYAIGYGVARELRDYITVIRDSINPALPLGIGERPYKSGKPDNSEMDISELQKDTDFVPEFSFENGIKRTIEYFKKESE